MRRSFILIIVGLALVALACHSYAQVVELSVSGQQEKNFNAFIAFLRQHASLKHNDSLIAAHRAVFTAVKKNDAQAYKAALRRLDSAVVKMSAQEQQDIYNFFLTLPSPDGSLRPRDGGDGGGGWCQTVCLFGSCRIKCPSGTKPKCFCQWGQPHCGCEPYGQQ